MKRVWIILFLSCVGLHMAAQDIAYLSLKDFFAQEGDTIAALKVEKRSKNQICLTGGADYKLCVDDNESLCNFLKKRCYLVRSDSMLYINCKRLRYKKLRFGNWYAPAMEMKGNLYFSAMPLGTVAGASSVSMGAMLGGAIGDAIAASAQVSKRVYYEIDTQTGKIDFVGREKMLLLLDAHPKWKNEYEQKESESAEVTEKYLLLLQQAD